MKLYTKIINEETKECLIINQIEAEKQGLQNMEVEFSYDGKAYLKGYAPQKPQELINQEKITEYQKYLADTDYVVVKISEAMVSGDKNLLENLKYKYNEVLNKREEVRNKINGLEKEIKNSEIKIEAKDDEIELEKTKQRESISEMAVAEKEEEPLFM